MIDFEKVINDQQSIISEINIKNQTKFGELNKTAVEVICRQGTPDKELDSKGARLLSEAIILLQSAIFGVFLQIKRSTNKDIVEKVIYAFLGSIQKNLLSLLKDKKL